MPKFQIVVTRVISETIFLEDNDEENAKKRAVNLFNIDENPLRTDEYMVEVVKEDEKPAILVRGFLPQEICPDHDMPFVRPGMCSSCLGATGFTD